MKHWRLYHCQNLSPLISYVYVKKGGLKDYLASRGTHSLEDRTQE